MRVFGSADSQRKLRYMEHPFKNSHVSDLVLVHPRVDVSAFWLASRLPVSLTQENLSCSEAGSSLLDGEYQPWGVHPVVELDSLAIWKNSLGNLNGHWGGIRTLVAEYRNYMCISSIILIPSENKVYCLRNDTDGNKKYIFPAIICE